jgi:GNAT superfamily N-acetyltransferase
LHLKQKAKQKRNKKSQKAKKAKKGKQKKEKKRKEKKKKRMYQKNHQNNHVFHLLILLCCVFWISLFLYLKAKYGFWIQQPVFHIYNLNYYFFPPGVIDATLPEKNKFTNFLEIETVVATEFSTLQWQSVLHLIRRNYLQNPETQNHFSPQQEQVAPYFDGHNAKCFLSVFTKPENLFLVTQQEIVARALVAGFITSRPITVFFYESNAASSSKLDAYYVDYLCVDKRFRNQGLAPQLIQTHHYRQRHANKKRLVTLFKREQELTGIVPLCVYSTFGFSVKTWRKPLNAALFESKLLTVVNVTVQNFYYVYDFIRATASKEFDLFLQSDCGNLLQLIQSQNIFVDMLLENQEIKAVYFYRKTCVFVETDLHVLSCFGSINQTEDATFIDAFKTSFWNVCEKHRFGFAAIENISHNYLLIENLKEKTPPSMESPTAYFFYNFAYPTCAARRVLVLN